MLALLGWAVAIGYQIVRRPPTLHVETPAAVPPRNWIVRALTALLIERRLPYRVAIVADRLANAIGHRMKTVRARGIRFRVRRLTCDEMFITNVVMNHDYTPSGFEIGSEDTVIDVGGNIGTFALLASRLASRGRVIVFEPNSENYGLQLQNIALNGAENITAVHAAVAGNRAALKLFIADQGGFHSVLDERAHDLEKYELVQAFGLKDAFDEYAIERCDFLKLDCEGAEYDILFNLPAEYYARISRIAMEFHGPADPHARRAQSDALVAHLEAMGFTIRLYSEFPSPFRGGMIRAERLDHAIP